MEGFYSKLRHELGVGGWIQVESFVCHLVESICMRKPSLLCNAVLIEGSGYFVFIAKSPGSLLSRDFRVLRCLRSRHTNAWQGPLIEYPPLESFRVVVYEQFEVNVQNCAVIAPESLKLSSSSSNLLGFMTCFFELMSLDRCNLDSPVAKLFREEFDGSQLVIACNYSHTCIYENNKKRRSNL